MRLSDYHVIWHRPDGARDGDVLGNIVFSPAAGFACRTYDSFLGLLAEAAQVNVFSYDIRGVGDSRMPVAPAYANGKTGIGRVLGDDLAILFWGLRDYAGQEMPVDSLRPWIFCGHSLGTLLSIHAALFAHVRKVILLDPPLFPFAAAAQWALACGMGQRYRHPLSQMTRRRKRTFRNAEQAAWVFSKVDFFKGWPKERLLDYVNSNYKVQDHGLTLRHNPLWEADIVESQPPSALLALLALPKEARGDMTVSAVFGQDSPFFSLESQLSLRTAFRQSNIFALPKSGHMLVFQREEQLVRLLVERVLTPNFCLLRNSKKV